MTHGAEQGVVTCCRGRLQRRAGPGGQGKRETMQEMEDGAGLRVGWEAERAMRLTPSVGLTQPDQQWECCSWRWREVGRSRVGFCFVGFSKGNKPSHSSHEEVSNSEGRLGERHTFGGPWCGDGI